MGDVIHTLPALTDAYKAIPELKITWVIEENFQEIPHWHPAVEKVIPISLRKRKFSQIWSAIKQIRAQKYDLIIDGQGLLKSVWLARLGRSKRFAGFDRNSVREVAASYFYNEKYTASRMAHAIDRLRLLFAQTFKYQVPNALDFGVPWQNLTQIDTSTKPYIVFLHGTTWESKHWPDEYWISLADLLAQNDLQVHVTWVTPDQKMRAETLAATCKNVVLLPYLTLQQTANLLYNSVGVVAVDTGFAHLTAALAKPLVAVFGPTDTQRNGTVGHNNINLSSKFACAPCLKRTCSYPGAKAVNPPCFQEISPQVVWQNLSALIAQVN